MASSFSKVVHVMLPKRKFLCLIAFAVPILLFQNCLFEPIPKVANQSSQGEFFSGNGQGYEGKLITYKRRVPGFDCGDDSDEYSRISFIGLSPYLTLHKEGQCGTPMVIDPLKIVRSDNTNQFIGYREGVYKVDPVGQPSDGNFVEAWCRATPPDSKGLEVFVEWDSKRKTSYATIFDSSGEELGFAMKEGSRLELTKRHTYYGVHYSSEELMISLFFNQKSALRPFEFEGKISGFKRKKWKEQPLTCRKGGEFDAVAPFFLYDSENSLLIEGELADDFKPLLNKRAFSFEVNPLLPEGLLLDTQTGIISGVPSQMQKTKTYEVIAHFKGGNISRKINIGVGSRIRVLTLTDLSDTVGQKSCQNCSLRKAIQWANQSPFPALIELPKGRIILEGEHIVLNSDVKILGQGMDQTLIDANFLSRIFYINPQTRVQIEGVSMINGRVKDQGGAIYSKEASLFLNSVKLDNNAIPLPAPEEVDLNREGGAIYGYGGHLSIRRSILTNNQIYIGNDKIQRGGAVLSYGASEVFINQTLFKNNKAFNQGGGLFIHGNQSQILNSQFIENHGGGAHIKHGSHYIDRCLFAENVGLFRGGGLTLSWSNSAQISNSTFFNNQAKYGASLNYIGMKNPILVTHTSIVHEKPLIVKHNYSDLLAVSNLVNAQSGRIIFRNSTISSSPDSLVKNCETLFLENIDDTLWKENNEPSGYNVSSDNSCYQKSAPGNLVADPLVDSSRWRSDRLLRFYPESPATGSGNLDYCEPTLTQENCHRGSLIGVEH